ncbi:MAG: heavy-metal-associated domain-containing protein [Peptococcaceae bacterium]|jgi:copper chaperone CopZ|nr:heavy-metal-associated domain-containing protein [Peptococcaceae bacterium]
MSWYFQNKNQIDSALLIITNMSTKEDFLKIKNEFMSVEGIKDVKYYPSKRIQVLYDNGKITLQHLTMILDKTGYKYVKRACRNCMK